MKYIWFSDQNQSVIVEKKNSDYLNNLGIVPVHVWLFTNTNTGFSWLKSTFLYNRNIILWWKHYDWKRVVALCHTPIWAGKSETLTWVAEIIVASLLSLSDKACLQEASRWNFWCSGFRFIPGPNSDWDLNIWAVSVIFPSNKDYINNCINKIPSLYQFRFSYFSCGC